MLTPTHAKHLMAGLLTATLVTVAQAETFTLSSPDLGNPPVMRDEFVFNGFGCAGGNLSPALEWTTPPAGTRSFAITMYDPDAPTGSGWWHWVAFNLPDATRQLPTGASTANQLPEGTVEGRTDYGTTGYGGPCPPEGHGTHRYQFKVFALNVDQLALPADASAALVGFMLNQHAVGIAELEVGYSR